MLYPNAPASIVEEFLSSESLCQLENEITFLSCLALCVLFVAKQGDHHGSLMECYSFLKYKDCVDFICN